MAIYIYICVCVSLSLYINISIYTRPTCPKANAAKGRISFASGSRLELNAWRRKASACSRRLADEALLREPGHRLYNIIDMYVSLYVYIYLSLCVYKYIYIYILFIIDDIILCSFVLHHVYIYVYK